MEFIKPMLAQPSKGEFFVASEVIAELKLDGVRAQVHIEPDTVKIYNRNGVLINDRYPDVVAQMERFRENYVPNYYVFDGEIVCGQGRKSDFHAIQIRDKTTRNVLERIKSGTLEPAMFIAFDVLIWQSVSYMDKSLAVRDERLASSGLPMIATISRVGFNANEACQTAKSLGYEGIVIKQWSSRYYPGKRSSAWVKWKAKNSCSAFVVGIEESTGSRHFGALRVAVLDDDDKIVEIGTVGSGFAANDFQEINDYIKASSNPLIVEIEYLDFPDTRLRQPVYKGIRTDVEPTSCRLRDIQVGA